MGSRAVSPRSRAGSPGILGGSGPSWLECGSEFMLPARNSPGRRCEGSRADRTELGKKGSTPPTSASSLKSAPEARHLGHIRALRAPVHQATRSFSRTPWCFRGLGQSGSGPRNSASSRAFDPEVPIFVQNRAPRGHFWPNLLTTPAPDLGWRYRMAPDVEQTPRHTKGAGSQPGTGRKHSGKENDMFNLPSLGSQKNPGTGGSTKPSSRYMRMARYQPGMQQVPQLPQVKSNLGMGGTPGSNFGSQASYFDRVGVLRVCRDNLMIAAAKPGGRLQRQHESWARGVADGIRCLCGMALCGMSMIGVLHGRPNFDLPDFRPNMGS